MTQKVLPIWMSHNDPLNPGGQSEVPHIVGTLFITSPDVYGASNITQGMISPARVALHIPAMTPISSAVRASLYMLKLWISPWNEFADDTGFDWPNCTVSL